MVVDETEAERGSGWHGSEDSLVETREEDGFEEVEADCKVEDQDYGED